MADRLAKGGQDKQLNSDTKETNYMNELLKELKKELELVIKEELELVKSEIKNVKEELELNNLKYNALKDIFATSSRSLINQYRGEYVSEGVGLNSRRKKFVNNPYW